MRERGVGVGRVKGHLAAAEIRLKEDNPRLFSLAVSHATSDAAAGRLREIIDLRAVVEDSSLNVTVRPPTRREQGA
jgi:hypothetical protein